MALKSYALLIVLFLFLISGHSSNVIVGRKGIGGWQPISDPKDSLIQNIGKFAVTIYNKNNNKNLIYQEVIKGETQVVAGTNYRLIIAARDDTGVNNYQAIVFDQPWSHTRNLISFKRLLK
ncbi:Cystatin domain-containing protein [Heracleum sosnowskyi]|uniref:Cystatin domain-containing protein n=1 Tax=Heracleum sosnowskyi TaxID=360622 RepID=A0AAD8NBL1_9APIA|nr:Cystatin domain-containing protein [Heracleum sosnowskyi]